MTEFLTIAGGEYSLAAISSTISFVAWVLVHVVVYRKGTEAYHRLITQDVRADFQAVIEALEAWKSEPANVAPGDLLRNKLIIGLTNWYKAERYRFGMVESLKRAQKALNGAFLLAILWCFGSLMLTRSSDVEGVEGVALLRMALSFFGYASGVACAYTIYLSYPIYRLVLRRGMPAQDPPKDGPVTRTSVTAKSHETPEKTG